VSIYARVSSNEQVDEGSSIDGQIDELESIADERNIDLVDDAVRDEGKSGTDFEREGIQKVFRLANEMSLSYVLVDSIDRLGRAAAQTLYFIYVLQEDCQTTVITSTGELNINQVKDLMQIYQTTLMAEMETKGRARSALRSRARGFLVDHKWKSWFHQIPFGYEEDGDWIKPARTSGWFAKWMFEHYRNTESYKDTKEALNENEDILGQSFTRSQVKSYLQKKVYIGQPTIPVENIHHYEDNNSVHDESLQLITEDLYADVQDIIMKNERKYSTDPDTKSRKDFINEFGMFPVAEASPIVKLHCPDCGTELVQDGQRTTWGGWDQHVYKCPAPEEVCRRRPTWPTEVELTAWVMLNDPEFEEHLPQYPEYDGWVR
jgi:predicted site-specific integrase-resolvase